MEAVFCLADGNFYISFIALQRYIPSVEVKNL